MRLSPWDLSDFGGYLGGAQDDTPGPPYLQSNLIRAIPGLEVREAGFQTRENASSFDYWALALVRMFLGTHRVYRNGVGRPATRAKAPNFILERFRGLKPAPPGLKVRGWHN